MRIVTVLVLLVGLISFSLADIPLQSVYQNAPAHLGFDKYLVLSDTVTYTGGLTIQDARVAIIGTGSIINLNNDSIAVRGNSEIEIQGCVIKNGDVGLFAVDNVTARISNCTFYGNGTAVHFFSMLGHITIFNAILANNNIGFATKEYSGRHLSFIDMYQNPGGDYLELCPA